MTQVRTLSGLVTGVEQAYARRSSRGVGRSLVVRRTVSGFALVLAALALAGGSAEAVAPRHGDVASRLRPRLQLFPHVAVRGQAVLVSVTSVDVPSLEVNVEGGTSVSGHPLRWRSLHLVDGEWRGAVPLPVRRGVYSLELRVREGGRVMSSSQWLLRVFAHGTQSRPAFPYLREVAAWWVRTVHPGGYLVATRRWRLSADDLRDPRRHQRLVIAYSLRGHRAVKDRLGVFVTAVRASPTGRWRLLEASVEP